VEENRVAWLISDIFLTLLFDFIEQFILFWILMEEPDIEIIVAGEITLFFWNNEAIQNLAEELGETDFPEPRPCG